MALIKQRRERTEFSLSAMVDVVFLLLLFFVATHVSEKTEAILAIQQPKVAGANGAPLEAQVHPSGYTYMGRSVALEEMETHLMDIAGVSTSTPLFIKVNPHATEGQLVALLDRCHKMNLTNLNVLTLKSTD